MAGQAPKQVCIVCGKERVGIPVKEDFVIRFIRRAKDALKIATGNKLVVCREHIEVAQKKREKFERGLLTYAGIGAVLGVILVIVNLMTAFDAFRLIQSLVLLVLLVGVMAMLSLYQYFPAIAAPKAAAVPKAAAGRARKKR